MRRRYPSKRGVAQFGSSEAFKTGKRDRRPVIGKSWSVVVTAHCLWPLGRDAKLKNWVAFEWRALVVGRCDSSREFAAGVALRNSVEMANTRLEEKPRTKYRFRCVEHARFQVNQAWRLRGYS